MPITPKESVKLYATNRGSYRASLVHRSHQILKMGYDLLDAPSLAASEEEVITGRLTKAMQDFLEDLKSPLWAKNFWANEETRVNDDDRDGKRRLRIDIEVTEHIRGPRPRFRFEAKRLRDTDSRRDYLGEEGLGCFLDGRYASNDPDAGMIAYVQDGDISEHITALAEYFVKDPARYGFAEGESWADNCLVKGLQTLSSSHKRTGAFTTILVFHSFLSFR